MSNYGYKEVVAVARTAGPVLNTFTTAISCLPTHARHTLEPDGWFIGRQIHVHASGGVSNVVTSQPTFTFEFRLGPTSTIVAFTTGAILTSTTAHTLVPWVLDIDLTVRAVDAGTATNMMGQATILSRAFLESGATADLVTSGHSIMTVPKTSPAVGTGFDCNVANIADLFVACSASAAGNGVTLQQYQLSVEN